MSLPLISVIIPTHNRRNMVCESIDSVLSQTYENVEIFVVDDGSTDGTFEYLQNNYSGLISIVRTEKPSGAGHARNVGASYAKGEFIAFLDSDDLWLPNKLADQYAVMEGSDNNVALVGSACAYIDFEGNDTGSPSYPPASATYEDFCIKIELPGSGSNHLIKTSVFHNVGGFDETLIRAQDKDLWMRILESHDVAYSKSVTAKIRLHDTHRVGVNNAVIIESREKINQKIKNRRIRRKAAAWSYFMIFTRLWPGQKSRALYYLLMSFVSHPFMLSNRTKRLKPSIAKILAR